MTLCMTKHVLVHFNKNKEYNGDMVNTVLKMKLVQF
jgi:hypothetical protein